MRKKIILLFVLLFGSCASNILLASSEEDLDKAYQLMLKDGEAAKELILELKMTNDEFGNDLWMVRSNFYLAYISKNEKEYGKSVIYYLEAIRYAENAEYDGVESDRIALHKNIANIFQQFKSYNLATQYNMIAIEIASASNNDKEVISVKYNQSRNLRMNQRFDEAIDLFKEILPKSDAKTVPKILNEMGIAYMLAEDWGNAEFYFQELANYESASMLEKAKSLHNIGEIEFKKGNHEKAILHIKKAIDIKEALTTENTKSLFISYKTIGEYILISNKIDMAGYYLKKAENLLPQLKSSVDYINIYDFLADYYFKSGNSKKAQQYSHIYSSKLEDYIMLQKEIQETDKRFNLDLITKRYFDEVSKQEKIASILLYSRLISGSLLALLLFVIGYNRYEKLRVRKSIERQLLQFEMID